MKKVFLALAAIAIIATVSSCNKTCTCTTYVNGNEVSTVDDIDISENDHIKKCSDMNSSVELLGQTSEVKCKSQL